ncbi:hypothetical protein CPY51_04180 [Rhizobium tubonense]|uniref:Uncharacterized protein n=1 Tax=Rhizobium tubonense TaxID=484088 RepID=A0A2W4F545_9HYPH|nr:hypothetical protein [Rhizobium tubonense]PZM16190.1 hypothetical protein CPY51_04180 [Rhizobium tubonense]
MSGLRNVAAEILRLFVDDGALALAAFALVLAAITAVKVAHIDGLVVAIVFLFGCLVILGASLSRATRAAARKGDGS